MKENRKIVVLSIVSAAFGATVAFNPDFSAIVLGGTAALVGIWIFGKHFWAQSEKKPSAFDLLLFLFLFSGPPRLRSRDPTASLRGEIDWVVLLHLIVWILAFFWITKGILSHKLSLKSPIQVNALLLALILALSTIVSQAPLLTAFRAFQVFTSIVFAYLWVKKYGIESTLRALTFAYIVIAILIVLAAIFSPSLVYVSNGVRLRGDYIANAGAVGMLGFILLWAYYVNTKRGSIVWLIPIAGLLLWILVAARTRSAFAGFFMFLLLTLLKSPRVWSLMALRYSIIFAIPMLYIFWDPIFSYVVREEQSISTLSDRTRVWSYLAEQVLEKNPWLGIGFYAERIYTLSVNPGIGTAHGVFPLVLAGGGIIAFLLFVALLAQLIRACFVHFRSYYGFLCTALLMGVLSIGLVSEEMLIASPTSMTFFFVVAILDVLARTKKLAGNYAHSFYPQPLPPARR